MAAGAMHWLLWLPVLYTGFYYGCRCLEYGYRFYGLASIATGAMDQLLLWLPLPGIWLPVLWTGSYGCRCYGPASTMAIAAWIMATGSTNWLLWTGFCYSYRYLEYVTGAMDWLLL